MSIIVIALQEDLDCLSICTTTLPGRRIRERVGSLVLEELDQQGLQVPGLGLVRDIPGQAGHHSLLAPLIPLTMLFQSLRKTLRLPDIQTAHILLHNK